MPCDVIETSSDNSDVGQPEAAFNFRFWPSEIPYMANVRNYVRKNAIFYISDAM